MYPFAITLAREKYGYDNADSQKTRRYISLPEWTRSYGNCGRDRMAIVVVDVW
jgi:hypothetical protein